MGTTPQHRIQFYDGSYYQGEVDPQGKEHGQGTLHYANKDIAQGLFWHGSMISASITFVNGDKYVGPLHDKKYHGLGTLSHSKGTIEKGLFRHGLLVHGTVTNPEETYVGSLQNGLKHGEGSLKTKDCVYSGQFKYNLFDGIGCLELSDKTSCKGQFKCGVPHGKAKYSKVKDYVYEGEFVDGVIHGQGTITYFNKDKYQGEFRHSKKHGKGKYETNEYTYQGLFNNDYKHDPNGKLTFNSGTTYTGGIEKDLYCGKGKLISNDETYEGGFLDGLRDGQGLHTTPTSTYTGHFKNDMKHGEGKIIITNHSTNEYTEFIGTFIQNKRSGKGITKKYNEKNVVVECVEAEYVDDLKEGKYKKTTLNAQYSEEGTYKNNLRHGEVKIAKNGVVAVYEYNEGEIVKEKEFKSDY